MKIAGLLLCLLVLAVPVSAEPLISPLIYLPSVSVGDGTGLLPAYGFQTNNGSTDQVGIWKDAANSLGLGCGATGSLCSTNIRSNGSLLFAVGSVGANVNVNTSGNLVFGVDNTNDIGLSATVRPRTAYFGTSVVIGTAPGTALAGSLFIAGVTQANLASPSVGTIVYCTDCNVASACTSGGAGALAIRVNSGTPAWRCQ